MIFNFVRSRQKKKMFKLAQTVPFGRFSPFSCAPAKTFVPLFNNGNE